MLQPTTIAAMSFSFGDVIQIVLAAVAFGGLFMQVRSHDKRLDRLEKHREDDLKEIRNGQERLEEKFVGAIEDLGRHFSEFAGELRTVVAVHETRLDNIEERE